MQFTQQLISGGRMLFYAWFEAMHTRVDMAFVVEATRIDMQQIASVIETEIVKYEKIANRFSPESELSFVNENAFGKAVAISPELCKILVDCRDYNTQTLGYFDITVYSLNGCRNKANAFVVHPENNTVEFTISDVRLDLSGFIKGYALSKAMEISDYKCVDNALINIGNSSIFAKGNHPHGKGWKIRIPATGLECTLINECLTTSGNSDATKWPIVNPLNGNIEKRKDPISVITKNPAVGEVLAKAVFLASDDERKEILENLDGLIVN